jgi:hypothetical protein
MLKPKNRRRALNRRLKRKADSWRKTERYLEERREEEQERHRCGTGPEANRASNEDKDQSSQERTHRDDYTSESPEHKIRQA